MCVHLHAGAVTALGRQAVGAAFAFGSYWCVGIPLAVLLGLKAGLGIVGQWVALLVASVLGCAAMSIFMQRLNWEKEAERIAASMAQEDDLLPEVETGFSEQIERLLPATICAEGV